MEKQNIMSEYGEMKQETENLKLPLMRPRSHFDFLTDWNGAMEKIDDFSSAVGTQLSQDNSSIIELDTAIKKAVETINALQEQVDALDPGGTNPAIEELKGDVAELKEDVESLQGEVTVNNGSIKAMAEHITLIDSSISTLQNQVQQLIDKTGNHDEEIEEIKQELYAVKEDVANLKEFASTTSTKLSELEESITSANEAVNQVSTNLDIEAEKIVTLQTDVQTALTNAQTAESNAGLALTSADEAKNTANSALAKAEEALSSTPTSISYGSVALREDPESTSSSAPRINIEFFKNGNEITMNVIYLSSGHTFTKNNKYIFNLFNRSISFEKIISLLKGEEVEGQKLTNKEYIPISLISNAETIELYNAGSVSSVSIVKLSDLYNGTVTVTGYFDKDGNYQMEGNIVFIQAEGTIPSLTYTVAGSGDSKQYVTSYKFIVKENNNETDNN